MILVFGGTTEGRLAVSVLDAAGRTFYYSTRGDSQEIACKNGVRLSGGMTAQQIESFCGRNGIRLIVDAAHPFASLLHENISVAARAAGIPVVRVERIYPPLGDDVTRCLDYDDAMRKMENDGVKRLLALTGVQTMKALKPFWSGHDCFFRILDRAESVRTAEALGFPADRLLYYHAAGEVAQAVEDIRPDAILTKESGVSGGLTEKIDAAKKYGVRIYVVCRPSMPEGFIVVTGRYGLRRTVERLLPDFFPLRSGVTTGTCATAAAVAAVKCLVGEECADEAEVELPDGEIITVPVKETGRRGGSAYAVVVKDAGDDPDVTHLHEIAVAAAFSETHEGIRLLGGEGVGTVTLPGLGLPVGGPAINKVPRMMIEHNAGKVYSGGLDITVSVPGGEELAKRTFNPKVGVEGGISIIGTSGIVMPFSAEAFVEAIRREIEVGLAVGAERIVINSGARSERFVRCLYPALPLQAFVHYGNFIGETIKAASVSGVRRLDMGIMIGKAVKLAEGNLDTHSHKVTMNRDFIMSLACDAGCSDAALDAIANISLARELWNLPHDDAAKLSAAIVGRCMNWCSPLLPGGVLTIMLLDEDGNVRCTTDDAAVKCPCSNP